MTEYNHQEWMKYMRRHEANVFNAIFYDKEEVTEDDIRCIIADVATFFDLPKPDINNKCESFAEVLMGDKNGECELSYNLDMLKKVGINNKDAFTLCFVHEIAHQVFYTHQFMLFCSERWMQELAADLTAGLYAERHHLATGKFKYALSRQKYSITHPDGELRKDIVECGRHYLEQQMVNGVKMTNMVLQTMPSFVFTHKKELKRDWYQMLDDLETPPQAPKHYNKQVKEDNKGMALSTALVYGGVLYDANENDLISESRNYTSSNHIAWNVKDEETEPTRSGWGYLPGTKLEAETIYSKLDSAGIHSTLISGFKANEESFKNKTNGKDLIHIATHGFFLADKKEVTLNPFVQGHRSIDAEPNAMIRSGLLLAGANRTWTGIHIIPGIEDGILTAEEISNVNLSGTKLVVLSACETGLGEIKSSEGVFGLQRAFKLAGVQSLIMSLWKVDDNATMLLMNTFYGNWIGGMPKHDAFNNAIEKIREQYKSPYYWAAFIMLD